MMKLELLIKILQFSAYITPAFIKALLEIN